MLKAIDICEHMFIGPFSYPNGIEAIGEGPGVYIVAGATRDSEWRPFSNLNECVTLDVGQATNLRSRIDTHNRSDCWERHGVEAGYSLLEIWIYYDSKYDLDSIENEVRKALNPICGKR